MTKKIKNQSVATEPQAVAEKVYLTAKEAAAYIGATLNYFYKLTSRHRLPMYNPTGRRLLFKRSELDSWVMSSRVATDAELETMAATELMREGGAR